LGNGTTVLRGGYGRTYGRLNGVDLVLLPLLSPGVIQAVQCTATRSNGTCGSSASNPTSIFRIGTDGLTAPLPAASPTLPQPFYPGVNGIAAAVGLASDPNFRPNVVDSFTLTFARQLTKKISVEMGYIGRLIHHEYTGVNLNAVPYMMTTGGQSFANAYANTVPQYCGGVQGMAGGNCAMNAAAVTAKPFFEAALSGTGYCNGYANCTQAVVANEGGPGGNLTTQAAWYLYSDLDNGGFNFPRSMMSTPLNCLTGSEIGCNGQLTSGVGLNASIGYSNYNAAFVTLKSQDWHGVTMQSNFTWSKALGTGAVIQAANAYTRPDPFNLRTGYGYQAFDRRFIYNLFFVYQPRWYKLQSGLLGHLAGGWTIAPIFTAGSGSPITVGTINGGGSAFGEADSRAFFAYGNSENAIPIVPFHGNASRHKNVPGDPATGVGTGGFGVNLFANPLAAWNSFRQPILGYDTRDGGWGVLRGLPYWNLDLSVKKTLKITERFALEAQVVFTNILNHDQFGDPTGDFISTGDPGSWGVLPGSVTNGSQIYQRQMEFGIRLSF
jgi:hypothetical protein